MTTRTAQRSQPRDERGRYPGRNESHYPSHNNYSRYDEDEDDFLDEDEEDDDDYRGSSSRYWGYVDDNGSMNGDYSMNSSINTGRSYTNGTGDRSFNGYAPRNENYWAYSEHRGDQYPLPEGGYTSGYGSQRGGHQRSDDDYTRDTYSSRGGSSHGNHSQRNGRYADNNDQSHGNYSSGRSYSGNQGNERNGRYNDNENYSGHRSGHGRQGFAFNEHERDHGGFRSHNRGGVKASTNYSHSGRSNAYGTRGHGPVSIKHTRLHEFERGRGNGRY